MAHNRCSINVYGLNERVNWLNRIDCKELLFGSRSRQNKLLGNPGRNKNQSEWCRTGKNPLLRLSSSAGSLCSLFWPSLLSGRIEGRERLFPVGAPVMLPLCLELGQKGSFPEKVSSACSQITHTHHSRKPSKHCRFHNDQQLPATPASSLQSGTCMILSPTPGYLWTSSDYSQGGEGVMKP